MQNSAARIISNEDRYASVHAMHNRLRLEWLNVRRKNHGAGAMYKGVNDLAPPAFCNMFVPVVEVTGGQTRAATRNDLYMPFYELKVAQGNFRVRGPKIWNYVPTDPRVAQIFHK